MKKIFSFLIFLPGLLLYAQNSNIMLSLADKKIEGQVWFTAEELKNCSVENVKIKKEDAQSLEITFTAKAPYAGSYGKGYNIVVNLMDKDKKILPLGYCWINNRRPVNNEYAQQYSCSYNGKAKACKSPYQSLENIPVQFIEIKIEGPFGSNKSISYYYAYTPITKSPGTQDIGLDIVTSNNNTNKNIIPLFKPEPIDDVAKNYISAKPLPVAASTPTRDIHNEVANTLPALSVLNVAKNLKLIDLFRSTNTNKQTVEFKEYVQIDKTPLGPASKPIEYIPALRISNYYTGNLSTLTEDLNAVNNFEIYPDKNDKSNVFYYRPKMLFLKHNPAKKEKQYDMRISYGTEEKDPFIEFTLTSGMTKDVGSLLSYFLLHVVNKSYTKFLPYYNKETNFTAELIKGDAFETKDVRIEPAKGTDEDRNMVMTMTKNGIDMLVENLKDYNSEYKVIGTLKNSGDNSAKPLLFLIDPTSRRTINAWTVPELKGATIVSSRNPSPFNSKPKFLHILNFENTGNNIFVPFIHTFKLKSLNGVESANGYQDIKLDLSNFSNLRPFDFIKAWIEYESNITPEGAEEIIDHIFGESNISIRPYNLDSISVIMKSEIFESLGITKVEVQFKSKLFDERNSKTLYQKLSFGTSDAENTKTTGNLFFRSDQGFDYSQITIEIKAYKEHKVYKSSSEIKMEDNILTITPNRLTDWIPTIK